MSKQNLSDLKVAWLIPSMARGFAWQGLLEKFVNIFPETIVYTGLGPMGQSINNLKYKLKLVGKTRFFRYRRKKSNYDKGIIVLSPKIVYHLLKYSPKVIFTHAFSVWTIVALLLKPFKGWRVIIAYDGSAPTVDASQSRLRLPGRKLMTVLADALITNTYSGKTYLVQVLNAKEELVFVRPYLVADIKTLCENKFDLRKRLGDVQRPVFLYVGLIIRRKGIKFLIDAFASLKEKGYNEFTLVIVGEGQQRQELEEIVKDIGIEKQVRWLGWVEYNSLGHVFKSSDIFVFPTFEDMWGLVVLEAMAFGKPVICSRLAGAVEMVRDGVNGFIFDPVSDDPETLSEILRKFIDDPNRAKLMGEKSKKMSSLHTPEAVAVYMKYVIEFVLGWRDRKSVKISGYSHERS